jgi:hypothetical protein
MRNELVRQVERIHLLFYELAVPTLSAFFTHTVQVDEGNFSIGIANPMGLYSIFQIYTLWFKTQGFGSFVI